MKMFGVRERWSVVVPYDLRHNLLEAGVLQVFERRPVSDQHRDLVWLASATDRQARIDRIVMNMLRLKQFNDDRVKSGFAGPRTTG